MSERYLIIGAGGQLGRALQAQYPQARAVDHDALNIGSLESIEEFDWSPYSTIFNAAAWTNVDAAQNDQNREEVWRVNALGPMHLAQKAQKHNFALVHISTDYVFDGTKDNYKENDSVSPLSAYGASKAAADLAVSMHEKHYILRTSWVIGDGNNFVRTMMDLAGRNISPKVVNDQIGRLTFASELVRGIDHLLTNTCEYGVYNLSNAGDPVSWFEIAQEVFALCSREKDDVNGISTAEYFQGRDDIAPRPKCSMLDLSKLESVGFSPHDWRNDLQEHVKRKGVA